MNRKSLLRGVVLALLSSGLAGAAFLACTGDDTTVTPDAGPDVVVQDSPVDAPKDQSNPVDAGSPAKLIVVHASPDLGPVRICFSRGPDLQNLAVAPLPPLPNKATAGQPFPGLFQGTGGPLPSVGTDFSNLVIVPYVMLAANLAAKGAIPGDAGTQPACDELFAADASIKLVENTDYFKLPPIPAGLLLRNKTFLLLATGCRPTATRRAGITDGQCGPTYNGTTGNIGVIAYELDRSPRAGTEMGVQFAHAAAPAADFVKQPVLPGLVLDGSFTPLGDAAVAYGNMNKDAATAVTGVAATDSFGIRVQLPVGPDASIVPVTLAASLPQIQTITTGTAPPPSIYVNGTNYTFVAIGDTNQPQFIDPFDGGASTADAGRFNGYTFHYLGFPNDPTLPPFTP